MSNPYALSKIESQLQQVYCDKRSLDILGAEINHRKWHADLLDDEGDPCGRMLCGVDSALPEHADLRWTCQLNIHFASSKYHAGPMGVGIGDTPQQAYDAACAFFYRFDRLQIAAIFRSFNHE